VGEFFLSHPDITVPEKAKYYSINEAYSRYWHDDTTAYIDKLKEMDEQGERSYSLRYIGSLVADFHRNLIQGGVFLYPRDKKSTDKPDGKLRLLYEAAPLALVAEEAGGMAITDDGRRIRRWLVEHGEHGGICFIGKSSTTNENLIEWKTWLYC